MSLIFTNVFLGNRIIVSIAFDGICVGFAKVKQRCTWFINRSREVLLNCFDDHLLRLAWIQSLVSKCRLSWVRIDYFIYFQHLLEILLVLCLFCCECRTWNSGSSSTSGRHRWTRLMRGNFSLLDRMCILLLDNIHFWEIGLEVRLCPAMTSRSTSVIKSFLVRRLDVCSCLNHLFDRRRHFIYKEANRRIKLLEWGYECWII